MNQKNRRMLDRRQRELHTPEADLFLRFLAVYPMADSTLGACEMLWAFLKWLKGQGLYVANKKTPFVLPEFLSHRLKEKD